MGQDQESARDDAERQDGEPENADEKDRELSEDELEKASGGFSINPPVPGSGEPPL